jgi:DNA-binding transcriptional regulator YhcF (GntR family)
MGEAAQDGHRARSARDVERAIVARIAAGEYPVGGRVPTCQELGHELGANKNTVSKAFQSLGRQGYLSSKAGLGTFVMRRPPKRDPREARPEVANLLAYAIEQADLNGFTQQEMQALAQDEIRRYFGRVRIRVGCVGLTRVGAQEIGRALQAALLAPVEPLVLAHVLDHVASVSARFDVLAVDTSCLAAVERRFRHETDVAPPEVVPILSFPDPESLTRVARLAAGQRLLIVSDTPEALQALIGLVRSFNSALEISSTLASNPKLEPAVADTDVILVTTSAERRVSAFTPRAPLIKVAFKLDEQSSRRLAERIASHARDEFGAVEAAAS